MPDARPLRQYEFSHEMEARLLRWSDSPRGATITLELPPLQVGEPHPFKGLEGTRFRVQFDPVTSDGAGDAAPAGDTAPRETRGEQKEPVAAVDTPNRSEIARQVYAAKTPGEKLVTKAALLCKDETFREWISAANEEIAVQWLYRRLDISSRSQIATNPVSRERFLDIVWQFEHREDPNA